MAEVQYTHPTLDKISQLRERLKDPAYQDDLAKVNGWEEDVKSLVAREELSQSPALDAELEVLRKDVAEMEERIRTEDSSKLPDKDRDRLLDKVALYKGFIARFDAKTLRELLAGITNEVDENLAHLNKTV